MQTKVVFWKRFNFTELGYQLIELFEDGTLLKRKFEKTTLNEEYYQEKDSERYELEGKINVEKLHFGENLRIKKSEFNDYLTVLKEFSLKDWKKARSEVYTLQQNSKDDLTIDYHSMIVLNSESLPESLRSEMERFDYPVVKFRFDFNDTYFQRSKFTGYSSVEFAPTLNERLYFHYIPQNRYLTMTGDNLFALHTEYSKAEIDEEGFTKYVQKMVKDVDDKKNYYRSLIIQQRERRAMLETDVIGDLYPR